MTVVTHQFIVYIFIVGLISHANLGKKPVAFGKCSKNTQKKYSTIRESTLLPMEPSGKRHRDSYVKLLFFLKMKPRPFLQTFAPQRPPIGPVKFESAGNKSGGRFSRWTCWVSDLKSWFSLV